MKPLQSCDELNWQETNREANQACSSWHSFDRTPRTGSDARVGTPQKIHSNNKRILGAFHRTQVTVEKRPLIVVERTSIEKKSNYESRTALKFGRHTSQYIHFVLTKNGTSTGQNEKFSLQKLLSTFLSNSRQKTLLFGRLYISHAV